MVVVGSGHSWSDVCTADTGAVRISLDNMPGRVVVANELVTCPAGIQIEVLQRELERSGRSLWNMGDVRAQTITGAFATGTHGSGRLLTESVVSFTLLRSTGDVVEVFRRDVELFRAVFSQGTAGIALSITLRTCAAFSVQLSVDHDLDLDQFELSESGRDYDTCLDYYLAWPHDQVYSRYGRRVVSTTGDQKSVVTLAVRAFQGAHQVATSALWDWIPSTAYRYVSEVGSSLVYTGVQTVTDMRTEHELANHWEMELAVSPEDVHVLLKTACSLGSSIRHTALLRVLPTTDLPFQQSTGGARVAVSFFAYRWDRREREMFQSIHNYAVRSLSARPHWGKIHFLDTQALSTIYTPACLHYRRTLLDPMFTNKYHRTLFDSSVDSIIPNRAVYWRPTREEIEHLFHPGDQTSVGTIDPGTWMGELALDSVTDRWDLLHDLGKRYLNTNWCGKRFGQREADGTQRVQPLCVTVHGDLLVLPVWGTYDGTNTLRYDHFPIIDKLIRLSDEILLGYNTSEDFGRSSTGVYFTLRRV